MPQNIQGTFVSSSVPNGALISDVLLVPGPSGAASPSRVGLINISGEISASNTVQTQFSDNNGLTWSNAGGAFSTPQTNLALNLALTGRQWRLICNMTQAGKTIFYSLSAEG